MKLSQLAETLIGSEIIKIASDINEKIKQGEKIYNFTIGDFDPNIFPIPKEFENEIIEAYKNHLTNYPAADGILELREAVSSFVKKQQDLDYTSNEILISAGGRPLIYATYRAIVDAGEKVIYTVPSWNNNHYTHFVGGEHVAIETTAEENFMPTASKIKPYLKGATLLALCSPLNPTGTAFGKQQLEEICDIVIEENKLRGVDEKKLFILFDQIYSVLTFGETKHINPVSLRPELKDYTVFVDGMSKAFCATGVRVGWAMGPANIIGKMKFILSHVGAWSPMPEQKAAAKYLVQTQAIETFLTNYKSEIEERLHKIYNGFISLKNKGFQIDAINPQAAIYLTIKFDLTGKKTADGKILETQTDVNSYILNEAKIAVVPFYCFGASKDSPWYRLSVGTCKKEEIDEMLSKLELALSKLA
ncbi:MAG: pyridoxal phosphate-dependent aminotransferase [Bacteroidota bacterium]